MKNLPAFIILICVLISAGSSAFPACAANVVAIDPGHQGEWVNMSDPEPMAPGSSEMKAKATTGTTGRFTGVPEYQLNLDISLKLRDVLTGRGYEVIMTREDNDTAISNSERALMAADKGGDVYIRIHANGSDDPSTNGALAMTMSPENPYVGSLYQQSFVLAEDILNSYCQETGFANLGIQYYDNMTGINWSKIPVMILEMGFMTNESDDRSMQDAAMQEKMVNGIANGLDAYFSVYGEDPALQQTKAEDQNGTAQSETVGQAESSDSSGQAASAQQAGQAGTQTSSDTWEDVGVFGKKSEEAMTGQGQNETSENPQPVSETAAPEETVQTSAGDMVYEQFVFTREMVGEKWAVAFVRPDNYTFVSETDQMKEDTENETADMPAETEGPEASEKITGDENCWMINGTEVMQSASVIKLFIMGSVYDRICYPSSPEKAIPYTEGYEGELRETLESMITVSSNEASNKLIDILGQGDTETGKKVVDQFCEEHGYHGVHLGRKFLENDPVDDNYISAGAVAGFLCDVYQGKLVNEEASEKMLTILKGQTVKGKIPAGLPEGYVSANKTGEMPEGYGLGCIENDAAIIWPVQGKPYILVVLSNDLGGRNDEAAQIIRQISAFVAADEMSRK